MITTETFQRIDTLTGAARLERQKYNRNARFYNLAELPMEWLFYRRWRRRLFSRLRGGRLLEVGVGTGKNLPYYPPGAWAAAIDLSEGMMSRARPLAQARGVHLVQMDAQRLAFRDNSFDAVVATFVFCSVPEPVVGLQEIRRVLKPDGQVLLLEHVLPQNPLLRALFNALDPLVSALSGVHINRRTAENLRRAGLRIHEEKNLLGTVFKFFVAERGERQPEPHAEEEDQQAEDSDHVADLERAHPT